MLRRFNLTQEEPNQGMAKVPREQRVLVAQYAITMRENELQLYEPAAALPASLVVITALLIAEKWEQRRRQRQWSVY